MAQTAEGAKKQADTIRKKYGEDYWAKMASEAWTKKPGRKQTGGFAYLAKHNPDRLREISSKAGSKSKSQYDW